VLVWPSPQSITTVCSSGVESVKLAVKVVESFSLMRLGATVGGGSKGVAAKRTDNDSWGGPMPTPESKDRSSSGSMPSIRADRVAFLWPPRLLSPRNERIVLLLRAIGPCTCIARRATSGNPLPVKIRRPCGRGFARPTRISWRERIGRPGQVTTRTGSESSPSGHFRQSLGPGQLFCLLAVRNGENSMRLVRFQCGGGPRQRSLQ